MWLRHEQQPPRISRRRDVSGGGVDAGDVGGGSLDLRTLRASAARSDARRTARSSPRSTSAGPRTPPTPSRVPARRSTTALEHGPGARARRPAAAGRRPPGARQGGDRARRVARHRQAPRRERVRRRRRGRCLPALRPGRLPRRPGRIVDTGQADVVLADRARAGRGLRPDHAVELPPAADGVEGRAVPGGRQHVRAQAQRAHPAHRDPPDAPARRGRPARRCRQPRPRCGRERRCAARRGPARRPGLVHRRPGDRPADHGHRPPAP